MNNSFLILGGIIGGTLILIGAMAYFGSVSNRTAEPITDVMLACVQHNSLGMHIHPRLTIVIDGQTRVIPSNVGVMPGCMRPLHTHDDSGEIHLEFPVVQDVRLGQFFQVWQQPLSQTQILDRTITNQDMLRVTVNGQKTSELENLLLHDQDHIVIEILKPG